MSVAVLLPFALLYTAADMAKAGNPISTDFVAKVTDVSGHGVVVFEGIGARRLWGLLIVDADYLRELIVGKTLSCVDAGETHGSWGGVGIRRSTSLCYLFIQESESGDYQQLVSHLLATGAAEEFCAETGGFFGTCRQKL